MIIEILSPSSVKGDREEKLNLYQQYALPEYWIVDPENKAVEVFFCSEGRLQRSETLKMGDQLHISQIPGLILEVAEIFR